MTSPEITSSLETGDIKKLLWQYALPAIIGTMVNATYSIIDRIFIGQGVGAYAISGLALTLPILILMQAFGMLIGAGSAARISISLGQKDKIHAEKILNNALFLTIITQIIIITLSLIFMKPMLLAFGGSELTIPYAEKFLKIVIPGNFLAALSFGFNNIMRATGYPKKAMYTMLIGAVANLILDPIFIFGLKLGIEGAAIATLISMGISATWVMSHFLNKNNFLYFKAKNIKLEGTVVWSIISIGMSPFFMQLATGFVNIIMNISLKKYGGDLAVGAFGINSSFAVLLIMFVIGLNQGMQPIAGFNYGAKLYDRVIKVLKYSIYIASIITTIGTLAAILIPEYIVRAFTSDPELISIASNGLRIYLAAFFIVGFQAVTTNFFQCIGMAGKSIFLSLTRQCIVLIPCLFILPEFWGLNGVWAAGPFSDIIAALLTAFFLVYQIRAIKHKQV